MNNYYNTQHLFLNELNTDDAEFISVLVNTPGWLKFIGDRNVKNKEDAFDYIQKIISNPAISYLVVRIIEKKAPIGIITFIKRDYLEYHDIGFAFLPQFTGQGYAYEAAMIVLNDIMDNPAHSTVLATTIKENDRSVRLLERLGFKFNREIQNENEILHVYSITANQ